VPTTPYQYDVATACPHGAVNVQNLIGEYSASPIVTALDRIDTADGVTVDGVTTGGTLTVVTKDALSPGDEALLDGLVATNDDSPTPPVAQVAVTNQRTREDGVLYAVPKPSSYGLAMCDRDMRLNTCVLGAGAVEDLKVDTQTNLEGSWNEFVSAGVLKLAAGAMVPCVDQADADANGVLSRWDYAARTPDGTPIHYELRDGLLYVDPALPAAEAWQHRAYAVVAPAIPGPLGGSIAVFDAYLDGNPDGLVAALSPQATALDPNGPGGVAAATLRLYVFHPAGSKLSHVLRLVSYRAPGTF
jgi:hypothetical protein